MRDNRSRPFWMLCLLCGAGVIAFVVWFGGVVPTRTCSGPLPAGVSALLAFQLARTPAEIEAVFGPAEDPCRAAMIAAMDRANTVDLAGFIVTYSAFLACFFLALLRARGGAAARAGLAAVVATLAFDVLETSTQLHMTGTLPGSTLSLTLLAIGSRGKFLGLAVVSLCAGAAMSARGRRVARLAGSACVLGGLLVVAGLADAQLRPALAAGNAVAWLVILLYAAAAVVRRPQGVALTAGSGRGG
jgi:hypothetical protein